jgi:hypothetical protein
MLRNIHKTQIRDVYSDSNRNYVTYENFTVGDDQEPTFPVPTGVEWSQEAIDALKISLELDEKDFNNANLIIDCTKNYIVTKYPNYTDFYNKYKNKDKGLILDIPNGLATCILMNIKFILSQSSDWNNENEKQLKYIAKYIIILLNIQDLPFSCNYFDPTSNKNICDKTIECILQNIKKINPSYTNFYNSFTNDPEANFMLLSDPFQACAKLPTPQPPTPQPPTPQPPTPQPPTPQPLPPQPSSDTENQNNTLLIIGIVIGSLFLLALIIFFLLHRN